MMETLEEKKQTVESIFDYNPTKTELRRFGLDEESGHYEERLAFKKRVLMEADRPEYFYLGILFSMRGDKERAAEYFAKAPRSQQNLLIQDC